MIWKILLAIAITTAVWLLAVVICFLWIKRKLRRMPEDEAAEWTRRMFGD